MVWSGRCRSLTLAMFACLVLASACLPDAGGALASPAAEATPFADDTPAADITSVADVTSVADITSVADTSPVALGPRWLASSSLLAPRTTAAAPALASLDGDREALELASLLGGFTAEAVPAADDPSTRGVDYIDQRGAPRPAGRPSRGRTILYSALVPGLGQLKWGARPTGVGLVLGEVASWTSFITFRVQGASRKDRYIDHAERFAGVSGADGEADSYFQALARYDRSDPGPGSYNEIEVRLVAKRELYPDDRAAQDRYIEENSITGNLAWNWESEARRFEFADIRSSSESAFHRAEFAIGGMVAGRILSLMHAIWMTAERPGDDDDQDSDERQRRHEDHGLAQAFSPYVDAGFDGACRFGLRARF